MANRKSGKELRKEYNDILDKTKALENRIINRAKKLIKQYPDVQYGNKMWKDNEIITIGDYKKYDIITPEIALNIIEYVENYLANLSPYKQQKLFNV